MVSYHQSSDWKVSHTFLALEPTFLVAVIGFMAFLTGILSDRYGRKTVMVGKFKLAKRQLNISSFSFSSKIRSEWPSFVVADLVAPKHFLSAG